MAKVRKFFAVEYDDRYRLADASDGSGAKRDMLFDRNNKLRGHAKMREIDPDEEFGNDAALANMAGAMLGNIAGGIIGAGLTSAAMVIAGSVSASSRAREEAQAEAEAKERALRAAYEKEMREREARAKKLEKELKRERKRAEKMERSLRKQNHQQMGRSSFQPTYNPAMQSSIPIATPVRPLRTTAPVPPQPPVNAQQNQALLNGIESLVDPHMLAKRLDTAYEGYESNMTSQEAQRTLLEIVMLTIMIADRIKRLANAKIVDACPLPGSSHEWQETIEAVTEQNLIDGVNRILRSGTVPLDANTMAEFSVALGMQPYSSAGFVPIDAYALRQRLSLVEADPAQPRSNPISQGNAVTKPDPYQENTVDKPFELYEHARSCFFKIALAAQNSDAIAWFGNLKPNLAAPGSYIVPSGELKKYLTQFVMLDDVATLYCKGLIGEPELYSLAGLLSVAYGQTVTVDTILDDSCMRILSRD